MLHWPERIYGSCRMREILQSKCWEDVHLVSCKSSYRWSGMIVTISSSWVIGRNIGKEKVIFRGPSVTCIHVMIWRKYPQNTSLFSPSYMLWKNVEDDVDIFWLYDDVDHGNNCKQLNHKVNKFRLVYVLTFLSINITNFIMRFEDVHLCPRPSCFAFALCDHLKWKTLNETQI